MAAVLLYILPVLLAFVLIPKSSESTTPIEVQGAKKEIVTQPTKLAEVNNGAEGKKSRSDIGKTRHGQKHRHRGLNVRDQVKEPSEALVEITTIKPSQETYQNNQKRENKDAINDAIAMYEGNVDVNDNQDEKEYADVDIVGDHHLGNDDAKPTDDDEISATTVETNRKEALIQPETVTPTSDSIFSLQTSSTSCPDCNKKVMTEKEIKVEMVKQHLLHKLGLTSVPEVNDPLPPLPFDFYVGEEFSVSDEAEEDEKEERRRSVKTREVFVFGKDITEKCAKKKGTGCYSFNITTSNINPDLVSSIELWIYKQPDVNDHHIQEFMVSELEPYLKGGKEVLRFRNIVKRIETRLKYGWMKIYVRRSVIRWFSKPHHNHGLAVVCKTCQRQNHKTIYGNKEGYMPILVFYMKQRARSHKRYRRDTQCIEGGNNCCHREELEINFRDIGWNYIMTPETIRPNFCTGSCNGIQAAYYNHTRLMQQLRQSVMHDFSSIQTCCSPVSFARPQSLLYRDHFGIVKKVDVPDLIIGECGCT